MCKEMMSVNINYQLIFKGVGTIYVASDSNVHSGFSNVYNVERSSFFRYLSK
jgi:hypothetical protein